MVSRNGNVFISYLPLLSGPPSPEPETQVVRSPPGPLPVALGDLPPASLPGTAGMSNMELNF